MAGVEKSSSQVCSEIIQKMKIIILNGDMNQGTSSFSGYLEILTEKFEKEHYYKSKKFFTLNTKMRTSLKPG